MPTLDDIGRAAARDALADASAVDVEAGLARVRTAGGAPASAPRNRPWAVLGASAAAVVVAIVAGVVVWQWEPAERLVPGTAPVTAPGATIATSTTSPPATTTSTAPPGTTIAPVPPAPSGLAVSYLTPPPMLQPTPFATIEVPASGTGALAVTMAGGAVFVDRDSSQAIVVAPDGSSRTVPLDATPFAPVVGPDDVLYGIDSDEATTQPPAFATIAVPLAGGRAGEVVASAPVDGNPYLELPAGALGLGPSGIVDRVRQVGTQLIGYVDAEGRPLDLDAPPAPLVTIDDAHTVRSSTGGSWALDIGRHPEHPDPYAGESPPAPTADGGAVYWTTIGPPTPESAGADYPEATIPVVAVLAPDGSAQWSQLPDGWGVAASDVGGTILASVDGDHLQLARLQTSPREPVPTTTTTVPAAAPDSLLASLSQQLGAAELIARRPGGVSVFRGGTTTEIVTPDDVYVWTDGEFLWTDDGARSTAMTLDGSVVCEVEGSLHKIRPEPDGGYVASVQSTAPPVGSELAPVPNFAVDCETGETQAIEPVSWRREGGGRYVEPIAGRTFTGEYDAEGNADVVNEAGVSINGEDYAGYHEFDETASRVAYLDMGASPGSPHTSRVVRARDTTTGEVLWTTELDTMANGLTWYGERILVHLPRADDMMTPAAVAVLDATTGALLTTVPTDLDIAHAG